MELIKMILFGNYEKQTIEIFHFHILKESSIHLRNV